MEYKEIIDKFVGNLMTVNHYALKVGLTTMGVYKQIERGKIKSVRIDGVIFIVQENSK